MRARRTLKFANGGEKKGAVEKKGVDTEEGWIRAREVDVDTSERDGKIAAARKSRVDAVRSPRRAINFISRLRCSCFTPI